MIEIPEVQIKALELLALRPEPSGSKFRVVFDCLVGYCLAQCTDRGYGITEAGRDWLACHMAGRRIPTSDRPRG